MARVSLDGVRKVYDNGFVAVADATFDIGDGELVVLVGPSGCGKSTTLRMIAGLESITSGTLRIGERVVNDVPPAKRDIAMVFQNYALYPHMSVRDNMAFALKLRNETRSEIDRRVSDAADILGLTPVLDRKPRQLSGGQRQRVALGRALVRKPQVFLFDEPLSNLDAKLRVQTRKEIARLHRRLGTTMVYVTHDQVEAMTLGDRIVVMNAGEIQQIGTPLELYERPANQFVAGFVGSPAMNFIRGTIEQQAGSAAFRAGQGGLVIPLANGAGMGSQAVLGLRPESLHVDGGPITPTSRAPIDARLDVVEPMGAEIVLSARTADLELVARVPPQPLPEPDSPIRLLIDLDRVYLFDAESGASLHSPA